MPEAQALAALRRSIDSKPERIKRVLTDAGIRREFFGGIPNDAEKAVRAFVSQPMNQSSALKKHPKVSEVISFAMKPTIAASTHHVERSAEMVGAIRAIRGSTRCCDARSRSWNGGQRGTHYGTRCKSER